MRIVVKTEDLPYYVKQHRTEEPFITAAEKLEAGLLLCPACMMKKDEGTMRTSNKYVRDLYKDRQHNIEECVSSWSKCRMCAGSTLIGKNMVGDCIAVDCDNNGERHHATESVKQLSRRVNRLDW